MTSLGSFTTTPSNLSENPPSSSSTTAIIIVVLFGFVAIPAVLVIIMKKRKARRNGCSRRSGHTTVTDRSVGPAVPTGPPQHHQILSRSNQPSPGNHGSVVIAEDENGYVIANVKPNQPPDEKNGYVQPNAQPVIEDENGYVKIVINQGKMAEDKASELTRNPTQENGIYIYEPNYITIIPSHTATMPTKNAGSSSDSNNDKDGETRSIVPVDSYGYVQLTIEQKPVASMGQKEDCNDYEDIASKSDA